ncbi:hypothetical protein Tco_0294537 [Tanacetum coccineum]
MLENCNITFHQTYDVVNGKRKTMRLKVAHFCGVYQNVTRMAVSGAGDRNYTHAGDNKEVDAKEVQRPMGRDTSKRKGAASSTSSTSRNEEALARLMLNEYVGLNTP